MNIDELNALTSWVEDNIVVKKIPEKYQALQQKLQQSTRQNQQNQPFDAERDDLLEALKSVPLDQLSVDQVDFLDRLGIARNVGSAGVASVEDLLYKNVLDAATSAKELAAMHKELKEGIEKTSQIRSGLSGCVDPATVVDAGILVRVAFAHDTAISNVVDLKKWSAIWHDIGRGVAMINDAAPENVRVVGAKKGSIVIELAVTYMIARTVTDIIMLVLKVTEKVVSIRRKAEEVRGLGLKNDKIARELDKEADDHKKDSGEEITETIIGRLGKDKAGQGDKSTALQKAIKNLIDFLEKGGEVDCVVPDGEADEEEGENGAGDLDSIRNASQEIRRLERRIKQLEHKDE